MDSHILPYDSSKALVSKDSEWQRLADIVRTWIYGSISPSLLQSVVRPDDYAFDDWNRLENNFKNNKTSRILHLESQFNDISPSTFSNVKSYCNELETIATFLNNLGTSITDNLLALQVLHGLTSEYKTFRSLVPHMNLIPSFDTLRSMLELEERSNLKHTSPAQDSALITTNKAFFTKIPLILTTVALSTTMVATATLVGVVGPTVAATMAPPILLVPGSNNIPGPSFPLLLGPTEPLLAHPLFRLIPLLVGLTGPDKIGPSLLLHFPLHLGLLFL